MFGDKNRDQLSYDNDANSKKNDCKVNYQQSYSSTHCGTSNTDKMYKFAKQAESRSLLTPDHGGFITHNVAYSPSTGTSEINYIGSLSTVSTFNASQCGGTCNNLYGTKKMDIYTSEYF